MMVRIVRDNANRRKFLQIFVVFVLSLAGGFVFPRLLFSYQILILVTLVAFPICLLTIKQIIQRLPHLSKAITFSLLLVVMALPIIKWQGPGNTAIADIPILVSIVSVAFFIPINRLRLPPKPLFFPIIGIFLAGLISTIVSADKSRSFLTLAQEAYLILFWITVYNIFTWDAENWNVTIQWVVRIWLLVAVINTVLIMMGRFIPELKNWFGYLEGNRGVGLFRDPNMAAHYVTASLFLIPLINIKQSGSNYKFTKSIIAIVLLGGLLSTGSNGGKVALVVALLIVFLLGFVLDKGKQRSLKIVLFSYTLLGLLVVGGFLNQLLGTSLVSQMQSGLLSDSDPIRLAKMTETFEKRSQSWRRAYNAFQLHPLGTGPGTIGKIANDPLLGEQEAHSDLLSILGERGMLGALAFLLFVVGVFHTLWKYNVAKYEQPDFYNKYIIALVGLFVFIVVMSQSLDSFHFRHFWFLLALLDRERSVKSVRIVKQRT